MHQNDGTHLDGGIAEDRKWQERWNKLVCLPPQRYDVPNGGVGRQFVGLLAEELAGIKQRLWNSERFLVFQMVVLQRCRDVTKARDIRRRITTRMTAWKEGKFDMLVQDTECTSLSLISRARQGMTDEQVAKTFNHLVLQGKLMTAV
jgi:hypothetical protein